MADKTETKKTTISPKKISGTVTIRTKRLSKSQRTHVRRMKAEAKKEGVTYRPGIA